MYEKFATLLEKHGVSAYKVSKETGISQATLSQWKSGMYELKADKLQKIADYFNVPLSYFYEEKQINRTYYVDDETREMLQCYFEKSGLRMLMQAARDLPQDQLEKVTEMINTFKGED